MRGQLVPSRRAGARTGQLNEASARPYSHPAPYGGWNARGNLANMQFTDAIQMDNVFPGVQDVQLRKGCIDWTTGFGANIQTLLAYNGKAVQKLFAATNSGIYDATAAGAVGGAVTAATNGSWSYVNYANAGGNFLVLVNGVDTGKTFDGTTWAASTITGIATTSLNYVTAHQRRLWFIENNSMNIWYLASDAIGGAATQLPVGSLFKRGGYLVALGSWTVDSGAGSDDLFVIVTSNGEIAVYLGTDPSSSSTWALKGVYDAARPVGTRPLLDYGGDLLVLTRNGLIPISKMLQSTVLDRSSALSYKIDGAMLDAAAAYSGNAGWQIITHKTQNMLVVNVPVSQDTLSYQFIMNTITGSWCRFTNWNARCWATLGDDLYFAGGTKVSKAWQGLTDAGSPITGTVVQAYSYLGMRGQKNISLARLNYSFSGAATIVAGLDEDFTTFNGQTQFTYNPTSVAAIWDVSAWDAGIWDGGEQVLDPTWTTIPNNPGYLHSLRIQITSSQSAWTWTSTDFAYRPAGIL